MDILLLVIFAITLLLIGLYDYKKVQSLNHFSKGFKSFSTLSLFSTIVATWVSGSSFFVTLTNTYFNGLVYFIPSLGMVLCLFILGQCVAPRLKKHLHEISVASFMKKAYGADIGKITAICGFIGISGSVAIQLKVIGSVITSMVDIDLTIATIIGTCIVIIYTTLGGINSVVKTDKLQFLAFFLSLPFVGYIFADSCITEKTLLVFNDPKFNIFKLHKIPDFSWFSIICLFLYYALPGVSPTDFQRLTMGVTTYQATKSYRYAAAFFFVMKLIMVIFPIVLYSITPDIKKDEFLKYIVDNFTNPFIKPVFIIGILSMAMSTADSMLNIGAVLVVNDFLKKGKNTSYLFKLRFFVVMLGILSLVLATSYKDLLQIIITTNSFYMPIVTIPLFLYLYNFRVKNTHILVGMGSAFLFMVLFKFVFKTELPTPPIGMFINIVSLIASYLILEKWNLLACIGIKSQIKK